MEEEKNKNGKDREATENSLIQAVGELVEENGFEQLGVNAIASRAGVSKMLIYRYFGSMEGLIATYIRQNDFWINFSSEPSTPEQVGDYIKEMFHGQIAQLRYNKTLKRLYRWELSSTNPFVEELRRHREQKGIQRIALVSRLTGHSHEETAAMATFLSASLSYLALLEENCATYNGIPLQEDKGWQQIEAGIDRLVDDWLKK